MEKNQKLNTGKCLMALLFLLGLLVGCVQGETFDGTFVNTAGSEFSIADDTLVVEQGEGNQFLIHRRTGFSLLDDQGRPGKKQYEKEEWKAVYDRGTEVMTESRNGIMITFNADRSILTAGKRKYKRI
ncbi:hypothetical protein HDC92_002839 [Pedobacter sp. AK017]|uniref:hypothetical protein n=1 Tax=Pedobacter sp. AK017 TaxID=2723073 RepID=UPI0016136D25|nr:hypothetical protein [Pedobacter sp. AK017]MBB5439152.1 hypothetical protein [Pedobacter sp. AK017]